MANPEHLDILKQGIEDWNQWRQDHPDIRPDLSGCDLSDTFLSNVNLSVTDLSNAKLRGANLHKAFLYYADLNEADLHNATLGQAILRMVDLRRGDLRNANFMLCDLIRADLSRANFHRAQLVQANLCYAIFNGTDLSQCILDMSIFDEVDLSKARGLESIRHWGPSTIGINTIYKSKGKIPESFLRGCGVPDSFIKAIPSLIEGAPLYYTCFISYSSANEDFAKQILSDLQAKGVRCWFAPEDLKWGAKIWDGIDKAITIHDKLLLVLSEDSIQSNWVEDEVTKGYAEERKRNSTVLFPIRIDDAVMETGEPWAVKLRDGRNIGDFRNWDKSEAYQKAFERLLRDLKAEEVPAGLGDR